MKTSSVNPTDRSCNRLDFLQQDGLPEQPSRVLAMWQQLGAV